MAPAQRRWSRQPPAATPACRSPRPRLTSLPVCGFPFMRRQSRPSGGARGPGRPQPLTARLRPPDVPASTGSPQGLRYGREPAQRVPWARSAPHHRRPVSLDVNARCPLLTLRLSALWVQVMAARPSAGAFSCSTSNTPCVARLPRLAGVTRARCLLMYPKGIMCKPARGSGSDCPRQRHDRHAARKHVPGKAAD